MKLNIGILMRAIQRQDPERRKFGFLPHMASCYLGKVMAESFAERTYRCAKDILTEGNSLLSHEEINMVVLLRMNRSFMERMREQYSKMSQQSFNMTLNFGDDNL